MTSGPRTHILALLFTRQAIPFKNPRGKTQEVGHHIVAGIVALVIFHIHVQRDLDKERMRLAANPGAENVR